MFKKFSVQLSLLIGVLAFLFLFLIYFYITNIRELQTEILKIPTSTDTVKFLVADFNQEVARLESYSFAFLITIIIILLGVVLNIISVFIVSLNRIIAGIEKFGSGDRKHRINLISGSEFGVIANYLDKVFSETDEYERQIRELSSLVSHQLKSPLTVIGGSTELLLENKNKNFDDEQLALLNDIYKTHNGMVDLIKNVLDVSKLDNNEVEFKMEKIELESSLNKVIDAMHEYIVQNGAHITIKSEGGFSVMGDSLYLNQVFQNLIDNSIRYSNPPAMIDILIEKKDDKIIVAFTDKGIGIPQDEQKKIMSRFYRATNAIKFKQGGTGLGLYIIRSVMEKMGGHFTFESKIGVGTTFYLEFPIIKS